MDQQFMHMIMNAAAAHEQEKAMKEEEEMLAAAIQSSLAENPNPDVMNYEQLQELGDRIGTVS